MRRSRGHLAALAVVVPVVIALRVLDAFYTWKIAPGLEGEQNPLESILGLGWPGIIVSNVVVVTGILILFDFALRTNRSFFPREPGLGFAAFVSHYYFDGSWPAWHAAWRPPRGWRRKGISIGLIGAFGVILVSALLVFSYFMMGNSRAWARGHNLVVREGYWIPIIIALVAAAMVASLVVSYRSYRRSRPPAGDVVAE